MLGKVKGEAVRLAGARGPLVVAVDIETAFGLANGLLGHTTTIWAALSPTGLAGLFFPRSRQD